MLSFDAFSGKLNINRRRKWDLGWLSIPVERPAGLRKRRFGQDFAGADKILSKWMVRLPDILL
jgi:hypothetical protein